MPLESTTGGRGEGPVKINKMRLVERSAAAAAAASVSVVDEREREKKKKSLRVSSRSSNEKRERERERNVIRSDILIPRQKPRRVTRPPMYRGRVGEEGWLV